MVTVGCCTPILDYTYLAIILGFVTVNSIAALKIPSLPYRFLVFMANIILMPQVDDSGMQFSIILFFLAFVVLFRAITDTVSEGGPDT